MGAVGHWHWRITLRRALLILIMGLKGGGGGGGRGGESGGVYD